MWAKGCSDQNRTFPLVPLRSGSPGPSGEALGVTRAHADVRAVLPWGAGTQGTRTRARAWRQGLTRKTESFRNADHGRSRPRRRHRRSPTPLGPGSMAAFHPLRGKAATGPSLSEGHGWVSGTVSRPPPGPSVTASARAWGSWETHPACLSAPECLHTSRAATPENAWASIYSRSSCHTLPA